MVNYKVFLSLFLIMSSCTCSDDELLLQRMDYTGSELRTDGYYFTEVERNVPRYTVYFIYRNGIILYGNSPEISLIEEEEKAFSNGEFYDYAKDAKDNWGVFKILGNEIEFERWYPSGPPLETWVRAGTILNDTTFHITRSFKPDGSDEVERDEVFHFKVFSPKPDSTNMFIP